MMKYDKEYVCFPASPSVSGNAGTLRKPMVFRANKDAFSDISRVVCAACHLDHCFNAKKGSVSCKNHARQQIDAQEPYNMTRIM